MNFLSRGRRLPPITSYIIFCVFFFPFGVNKVQAVDCDTISRDLIASYDVTQNNGGFWGMFERSSALKDKSMFGMQLDSKLRQSISIFEGYCQNEPKKATVKLAKQILDLIGESRVLRNNNPDRTPAKKILEDVKSLITKMTNFIKKMQE